jgi:uncharacterized protein (DUF302 family)
MSNKPMVPPEEIVSRLSFADTLEHIERAIRAAGMTLFATVDHAAGAYAVGAELPPTVVLIYGSPAAGTPIMQAAPLAALDLPLRVLVRETAEGQVLIAFHPAARMLRQAGVPEALAAGLEQGQRHFLGSLV